MDKNVDQKQKEEVSNIPAMRKRSTAAIRERERERQRKKQNMDLAIKETENGEDNNKHKIIL